MPEIKHQFTGGKMNKDLDERLVPNGEYRDAMNIQVSTSESSNVGTVQNILGNLEIAGQNTYFTSSAVCVGAIADEKNDKLYWFIKDTSFDSIFEYTSGGSIVPVLVDINGGVLNWDINKIITGINIIDDLLFWTDNENEPKVINIQRCKDGTDSGGATHTQFINDERSTPLSVAIKEEHITVIKKAPKSAPSMEMISERSTSGDKIHSGIMKITYPPVPPTVAGAANTQNQSSMWVSGSGANHYYDFSTRSVGDLFDTQIETDIHGNSGFTLDWEVGDTIVFKEFGGYNYTEVPGLPIKSWSLKAKIVTNTHTPNVFSDQQTEFAENGNFSLPNTDGKMPLYWTSQLGQDSIYSLSGRFISLTDPHGYKKIWSSGPLFSAANGATYKISFKLSNVGGGSNEGISVNLTGINTAPNTVTKFGTYEYFNSNGNKSFNVTIDGGGNWNIGGNGYENKIIIQTNSGGFYGRISNLSVEKLEASNAFVRCEVLSIKNPPIVEELNGEIKFLVDRLDEKDPLFEFKFARFAYRYQYQDKEYSTFSPFTSIAFLPGTFDYQPKKGYNLGMANRVTSVKIKNFAANIPDGVVAIDILYKDDASPNIYIVDTVKPKHVGSPNAWDTDGIGVYEIKSEQISQVLPSNQLLRAWDTVPRKALAQDVSGNRIIYANYVQGYDMKVSTTDGTAEYYPDLDFNILNISNSNKTPEKSVKSLREYQVGVVFSDIYGRETPVMTSGKGAVRLSKNEAENVNQLQVGFSSQTLQAVPSDLKYFKFYIKETSGEYYNMAMDRFYDAEDGGVWLSFPSSDRNKIDIDTFLILKKAINASSMVQGDARYKVLDVQNEAPSFIKQKVSTIVDMTHDISEPEKDMFGATLEQAPLYGTKTFKVKYKPFFDSAGSDLQKMQDGNLYLDFTNSGGQISERYRISRLTTDYAVGQAAPTMDDAFYNIKLNKSLGEDVNFITDDPVTGLNATKIDQGTIMSIYKYTEESSSKFDGRFFVKINADNVFYESNSANIVEKKYRRVYSKKLYYLSDQNASRHHEDKTGQFHGVYKQKDGFGGFAPFFRNYNKVDAHLSYQSVNGGNHIINVGQYAFGYETSGNKPWLKELSWITTHQRGGKIGFIRNTSEGNQTTYPGIKVGDTGGGWSLAQRGGVYNNLGEQTHGDVWFIDGGNYEATRVGSDSLNWASSDGLVKNIVPNSGTAGGISTGSTYSTIEIGIGGIYHPTTSWSAGIPVIDNFWNIGQEGGGNTNYDTYGVNKFVEGFHEGKTFRFREDPTGEVYTIQSGGVPTFNHVRYGTITGSGAQGGTANIQTGTGGSSYSNSWDTSGYRWAWYDGRDEGDGGILGGSDKVGWVSHIGHASSVTPNTPPPIDTATFSGPHGAAGFDKLTNQLSPNFTKSWRPKFLNSSGGKTLSWNPIGNLGPIANGLHLSINHSAASPEIVDGTNTVKIVVDGLQATHTVTGNTHTITTGMILISHSNAVAGHVFSNTPGFEYLVIKEIVPSGARFKLHLTGYSVVLTASPITNVAEAHNIFSNSPNTAEAMIFAQPTMNGYSQYSVNKINNHHPTTGGIAAIGYNLDFVEVLDLSEDDAPVTNPAIFETEPKEKTDLDVYYQASGLNPVQMQQGNDSAKVAIPVGSIVEASSPLVYIQTGTTVSSVDYDSSAQYGTWAITLNQRVLVGTGTDYLETYDKLRITKPNGEILIVKVTGVGTPDGNNTTNKILVNKNLYLNNNAYYILNWHNCYSFGNGVESNRIRDNFNLPYISNGVKVSTTLEGDYNKEHRKYGLIYSGLYNSTSGVNNLNQFIAAEKITKDVNPIYGSIQKIHSRDGDLVALCEDKCLRILANKDAVYNADGNPQLTANINVLGQTIPFSGEFGISKNPESFASESYRVYFTDKVRGAVMRLSKDGLTPISMYGMKDWFKDNLKLSTKLIGSYDDKKDEYNITLKGLATTVSFKEDVKGWVSFKSFVPELGISLASDYYTMKAGRLYKHHDESENRNTFYGTFYDSTFNVILNDGPGSIKSFHALNYEGSQAKITKFITDNKILEYQPNTTYNTQEYYNLSAKPGWSVGSIITDKDAGYVTDFIEKEGKWFTNMNKFIDLTL